MLYVAIYLISIVPAYFAAVYVKKNVVDKRDRDDFSLVSAILALTPLLNTVIAAFAILYLLWDSLID